MAGLFKIDEIKTDQQRIMSEDPYTTMIRDSLLTALESRASDIHYEPYGDKLIVRFRIDGSLYTWNEYDKEFIEYFVYNLKRQFNLPLTDTQSTASSSATYPLWGLKVRSSKVRFVGGEGIVVRLISLNSHIDFSNLGYSKNVEDAFLRAGSKKSGLIIVGGATGSGKSTTLHSLLRRVMTDKIKVLTLEDPVEALIPGAQQMNVSKHQTFGKGLKEFLRQDPDIIMVGEVRDKETAELCFHAANTGHLVMTTIHAESAWATFNRIVGLGLDPFFFAESINLLVSQKLFPRLCKHCSIPVDIKELKIAQDIYSFETENFRRKGSGCRECKEGVFGSISVPDVIIPHANNFYENRESVTHLPISEAILNLASKGIIDAKEVADA